ncbi:Transposase family Tnp2 protein [Ceratobasidium sp. AG-Ba]|nr:Transposase family Tnp2 protein [Ceratobasidium sp. AG-Ba]
MQVEDAQIDSADSPRSPINSPRPESLPEEVDLPAEDEHMHAPSLPADSPPASPRHLEPHPLADEDQDDQPLEAANEDDREYPFDHLFDGEEHRLGWHRREAAADIEPDEPPEADLDIVNELYDVDFGLAEDGHRENEIALPRFELPIEDELMFEPEDEPEDDNEAFSAAFREPNLIRNAYIDAFIQKTLYGATHRALQHQLKAARRTISLHPDIHAEDIAKMAQTIRTAERRLGVNLDHFIRTFTLCPVCKRGYSPEYIARTDDSECVNEGCLGILFVMRKLASGGQRKVSTVTYPFASPIAWIRHLLTLPGMSELLQVWRSDQADKEELTSPVPSEEWIQHLDVNKPISDIHEGWGWRSIEAGLERRRNAVTGDIVDESPLNPSVRFVSLPYGLSLSLNTDWFQATKEGNYSVGACYLALNNLPRHMRFLRENIALCVVMPGPSEPNSYALDQILTPLVDELLELKQGILMTVRRGDPPVYREELVHGDLTQHIADLIARIKMGGGAGVKSESNFCLYCHSRLSSLSVPTGFVRQDFSFRDPQQERNNVYHWKSLPTLEERNEFFSATGNRFTALHRIPGWNTSTSSPPDAMHLLYLGAMNWIVKQVLVGPGMFNKRHIGRRDPQAAFNECLDSMWMPRNFQRLPPKLGQTRATTKADQWKLTSRVLFIPLFLAFRDGDEIGPGFVPRGNRSSPGAKHQAHRAKLLHQQRRKYYESIAQPDLCPPLIECYPSRNLRFHYRQVLRFCVAVSLLDKRSVTPAEITFGQRLLESLCVDYVQNNVQLSPNFHYLMHLEEWMLKSGSLYNTHVWAMERANGTVSQINHNGKGHGILEGTLMRGWWNYTAIQNLITMMHALPDRTAADDSVIEDLTTALRGGPEHALQRGTLMAFIAQCQTAYTRLYGLQDSTRLSNQSRLIDLEKLNLYQLILQFCIQRWPNAGIWGGGGVIRTRYLDPEKSVRNYSYVEHNGVRYGAQQHTSGKGYCYGYIDGRHPVLIERILVIEIPGEPDLRCVCALVRKFQAPPVEPNFPWDAWSGHLGASSWAYGQLGELTIVSVHQFAGALALFDIQMSYGRYWVTVALDTVQPERDVNEGQDN